MGWAKLDCLYVLKQNWRDALLNLVGTSYAATNVNGATFTAYQGFSGFAGINAISDGFIAATTNAPKLSIKQCKWGHGP